MIVDFHTHVFPPEVVRERERFLRLDATFAALYSEPRARLATAADLRASMDAAGIDVSVALGFAWSDADLCARHNDYLLESAASSGGRLAPFCTVQPAAGTGALWREVARCAAAGARGVGELRPEDQGFELSNSPAGDALAEACLAHGLVLLLHVSEPTGHDYAGKGGLAPDAFVRFAERWPGLSLVAAHWGGGLPFYTLMPEVGAALASTTFDTAATSLLYDDRVFRVAADLVGADRVLFGSDYPVLSQARCRERVEGAALTSAEKRLVLGENAARLLGLE